MIVLSDTEDCTIIFIHSSWHNTGTWRTDRQHVATACANGVRCTL